MSIPKDPVMLLSFVNTQLRDHFDSLEKLCGELSSSQEDITVESLKESLAAIDYHYDKKQNQFI